MKLRAAIDIGSNSVTLVVGYFDSNNKFIQKHDHLEITSLGKELDKNKVFHAESMQVTYDTLNVFKNELIQFKITPAEVTVAATEAARVAKNSREFFLKIKNEIGFNVQIITSYAEAYYAALGATLGDIKNNSNEIIIMDIGGASTELIKINRDSFKIVKTISFPFGVVRATEWKAEGSYNKRFDEIRLRFEREILEFKSDYLLCIAGTMTSVALMYNNVSIYDEKYASGVVINNSELINFKNTTDKFSVEELKEKYSFLKKRAPFIKAGLSIACDVGTLLGTINYEISNYGLRHGLLLAKEISKDHLYE